MQQRAKPHQNAQVAALGARLLALRAAHIERSIRKESEVIVKPAQAGQSNGHFIFNKESLFQGYVSP